MRETSDPCFLHPHPSKPFSETFEVWEQWPMLQPNLTSAVEWTLLAVHFLSSSIAWSGLAIIILGTFYRPSLFSMKTTCCKKSVICDFFSQRLSKSLISFLYHTNLWRTYYYGMYYFYSDIFLPFNSTLNVINVAQIDLLIKWVANKFQNPLLSFTLGWSFSCS